jgi:putative metallohydrolase (TIGR04338 family)
MRDSQRGKINKAQAEIDFGKELPTVPEIEAYLKKIMATKWWLDRWPYKKNIQVKDGHHCRWARGINGGKNGGTIILPRWARHERTILHEVAHVLTPQHTVAHGPEFASIFLGLVTRFMGKDSGEKLRLAFVKNGVDHGHEISVFTEAITVKGEKGEITVQGDKGKSKVRISLKKIRSWVVYFNPLFPPGSGTTG